MGVADFDPTKLTVRFADGVSADGLPLDGPLVPRCYTLTNSEATGELFLTIGAAYDLEALSTWQIRAQADEALGEWVLEPGEDGSESPKLVVHRRIQGGFWYGSAPRRIDNLQTEMPGVLQAMRYGDRAYLNAHPELDAAPVEGRLHFRRGIRGKRGQRSDERQSWGRFGDYAPEE